MSPVGAQAVHKMETSSRTCRLFLLTILFLIVFASRVVRLNMLEMDRDEVWSVWQTFGTPQQIIQWTPYDWPPLFYLTVGSWRGLMGDHPFTLRLLTVYTFLIGIAVLYRVAKRLCDDTTALIAAVACS